MLKFQQAKAAFKLFCAASISALLCANMFAAQTSEASKIGKVGKLAPVPAAEAKKLLDKLGKLTKKTQPTKDGDVQVAGLLPHTSFVTDANTDELFQFTYDNRTMLVAIKKNQTTFAPKQSINIGSYELGKTLCAYMGELDPTMKPGGTTDPRTAINSAGAWVKLSKYPSKNIIVLDRSMPGLSSKDDKAFQFAILSNGYLQVSSTLIKGMTTENLASPKPIPLNEWVYIQARQNGMNYSIGWKTANDESRADKRFSNPTEPLNVNILRSAFMKHQYARFKPDKAIVYKDEYPITVPYLAEQGIAVEDNAAFEENNNICKTWLFTSPISYLDTLTGIQVKQFFWSPNTQMFALMDENAYNAAEKDIGQRTYRKFDITDANQTNDMIVELLLSALYDQSRVFSYADLTAKGITYMDANIDIYVNPQGWPVVFDLRMVPAE